MAAPITSVASGRKLSVLIASDRDSLSRTLADALRSQGSQPVIRETAEGAAEALESDAIDVAVIDTDLPSVDWNLVRRAFAAPTQPESLDAMERRHIGTALRYTRGNRRNAAQLLGIARSTLLAKIRKYGLDRDPALGRN